MERDRILRILREHEEELKAAGLVHLRLFGSMARGENTSLSDVDLLADLDPTRRFGLFRLAGLEIQLTSLLASPVHLTLAEGLKQAIRPGVLQDAIDAF